MSQDFGDVDVFESARETRGARGPAGNGPSGKFCRPIYRGLTITDQDLRYSGTDDAGWGFQRCAFKERTELRWRSAPASARRSTGGAFTVSEQETPRNAAAAGSLRSISTVDALIALQGVEDPRERKKRAVVKGRNALDVLDRLKLVLLDGSIDGSMLARLKVAAEGLSEQTGDPGLDMVMSEIDLRVAVELAKAGVR